MGADPVRGRVHGYLVFLFVLGMLLPHAHADADPPRSLQGESRARTKELRDAPLMVCYQEVTRNFYPSGSVVETLGNGRARVRTESSAGCSSGSAVIETVADYSDEYQAAYGDWLSTLTVVTSGTMMYVEQAWPPGDSCTERRVVVYNGRGSKHYSWSKNPNTGQVTQTGRVYAGRNTLTVAVYKPDEAYDIRRAGEPQINDRNDQHISVVYDGGAEFRLEKGGTHMKREALIPTRTGRNEVKYLGKTTLKGLSLPTSSVVKVLDMSGKPKTVLLRDFQYEELSLEQARNYFEYDFPKGTNILLE